MRKQSYYHEVIRSIISLIAIYLLCAIPNVSFADDCASYRREKAVEYAILNWNVPATDNSGPDCANFASKALRSGGLTDRFRSSMCTAPGIPCWSASAPGACSTAAECVNQHGNIIRAFPFAPILSKFFCAEVSSGGLPADLKKGDLIFVSDSILNPRSHTLVVVATNGTIDSTYIAAHTTNRGPDSETGNGPNNSLRTIFNAGFSNATYVHFPYDDEGNKCACFEKQSGTSGCKTKEKCTKKCATCDPDSGACQPKNQQWIPMGRCSQLAPCNPATGEPSTTPGGPMMCGDDTLTVGSGASRQPLPATNQGAIVGVLDGGFTYSMVNLLQSFKEDARVVSPDEISPDLAKEVPLLIIASAGLYGMEQSRFFKDALEAYVNSGGNIFVMSQQYGYQYAALPGEIGGYGWLEDQMCFWNSSYISTWHPVLAGQTQSTPTIGVDGYFTKYPNNTTIILQRTVNGQPDLILYPFGNGNVVVSAFYTDTSFSRSNEEIKLIRDIVAWAKAPTTLPEIRIGETINLNIPVKNAIESTINATQARIKIYDPEKKNLVYQTSMPIDLAPGEETVLPVAYTTEPNSATGIYQVLYDLTGEGLWYYDDNDPTKYEIVTWLLKDLSGEPSGRFAVTNPPTTGYQLSEITYSIQSDSFAYLNDSIGTFTIKIWNNSNVQRTITAKYDAETRNITIGPHGLGSISYTKNITGGTVGLRAWFYDETGKYLGSTFRNGSIVRPATQTTMSIDKSSYAKGETVSITATVQNRTLSEINTSWQADVKTIIYDSSNYLVFEDIKTVTIQPAQTVTATTNYVLPMTARLGTYTIHTYVKNGTSTVGWAYSRFEVPQSRISVAPNLTPFISDNNTISFTFSNTGAIKVDSGMLDVNLKDPEGNTVYAGTLLFGLSVGETKTMELPITPPSLQFGKYVLEYTQSDETKTGSSVQTLVRNQSWGTITSDKSSYKIGDSANISIAVQNRGNFIQEGTLTITVPILGLTDTMPIVLDPSESITVPVSIALPVTLNSNISVNAAFALSGDQIQQLYPMGINILPVTLDQTVTFDKPSYRIRETVGMNYVLTNNGNFASPLNATLSVTIPEINYEFTSPLVIEPGVEIAIPLSVTLPETLASGQHQVLTSITLPSGAVHDRVFPFFVPESDLNIQILATTSVAIGDTVTISVKNVGGLDTNSYHYAELYGLNESVFSDSGEDIIQAGASRSNSFQIPSQAGTGAYILYAGTYDAKTDIWNETSKAIYLHGLDVALSVQTDKDMYLSTEDITTLSEIVNGTYPVDSGNLHLQIVNKCDGYGGGGGGGGEIPQSFYFSTWDGAGWTDQGVLHYPSVFATQQISLTGYNVSEYSGECKVAIRHEGTGNAEIDEILLLAGEASRPPYFAMNSNTEEDILALVQYQDNETAFVLNKEIDVRWPCNPGLEYRAISMVAKEGLGSCLEKIYWQTDIPITQAADTTEVLNRIVNALSLTGQFYLQGTLSSSTGQIIAESEYPFSIVDGDIGLTLKTDKAIYQPGETVTITGAVVNLLDIEASGISLEISNETNILYTQTVNIAAQGSSAFSLTTTADVEGIYPILGSLSQNGNPLYSAGTTYEVAPPLIDPYVYGPAIVGSEPFTFNLEVYNSGKVPVTIQAAVAGGSLSDIQVITIPVNGSKLLQYSQQITENTTYTVAITGDVSQILEYTAVFGEKATIQINSEPAYREGEITIPYTIHNIGMLETAYLVNCNVTKDGQEVLQTSGNFVLPVNGSDSRNINLTLTEGLYLLTCETTGVQAQAQLNVLKTGQFQIALNTNEIYSEGSMTAETVLTNTGLLDESITVTYTLQPTAQVQTKSYLIAKGGSATDSLNYDLTEGTYQLIAASLEPVLSTVGNFEVRKENTVSMELSTGEQLNGLIPSTVALSNLGFNSIDGSVHLSLVDSQGASVWNSSQNVSLPFMAVPAPSNISFNINPAAIPPGDYVVKAELFNSSNQSLASSTQPLSVNGAILQITQLPPYQTFSAGQDAAFIFRVKNIGNQAGEADLRLKAYDLIDASQRLWLLPGEEKEVTFNFLMPVDLEESDYFADYDFNAVGSQSQKGQVKYHLAGINIQVSASLDKQSYVVGDIAHLTITVTQQSATSLNLAAQVLYGVYEEKEPFVLNGSETLTFDIPLTEITGQKLFYGIYLDSGRSLHLNSLYVYRAGEGLIITTDKQVYNPGDDVAVDIRSQTPGATGQMTLSISGGNSETFAFTGFASKNFTIPSKAPAGSYFIDAMLSQSTGTLSAQQAIDVAGLDLKVKDAKLDKGKYNPTDTLVMAAKIQSNISFAGTMKTSVIDPDNVVIPLGQASITVSASEEFLFSGSYQLTTSKAGMHKMMYSVYTGDLLLATGELAFDVGEAMLTGLRTDKEEYVNDDIEPVTAKVSMYGAADAKLELQLDGITIKTEAVVLNGFVTLNSTLGTVPVGSHELKAVLTSGGLTSTKATNFTVRQADTIPPETTINIGDPKYTAADGNLYVTSATLFILSATDDLSGVAVTEYRLDGGVWSSSASFNAGIEGNHLIDYHSQDNAGNAENIRSLSVIVDTSAPMGSIVTNDGAENTNNASVTLTLSCTDSASGCAQMQFSNDNTTWSTPEAYAATKAWMLVSGDGLKSVYVKYFDGVGNASDIYSAGITLDTMPPATTATPAGGIYNTVQLVTLTTNKTAMIYYTTDGTIPTTGSPVYGGSITIAKTTTLMFFAVDSAGNSEAITSTTYTIDTEAPVLTLSTLPDGSYTNNATLNIAGTVTDINEVQGVTINDAAVPVNADETFNQAITLTTGTNKIMTEAKDMAGNTTTDERTIMLDQTAPMLTITAPADNSIMNIADVMVTGVVDETSTVIVIINGGSPISATVVGTSYSADVTLTYGQNTIEVTATDLANNTTTGKRTVTFDNINPALAVTIPPQDITTNASSVLLQGTVSDLTALTVTVTLDGIEHTPAVTAGMFEQQLTFIDEKTYAVIVTAIDGAGNTSTVQRNIIYEIPPPVTLYTFTGFFNPVDNPPSVNKANAGQAIPIKWRITDANGVPVSDPASFISLTSYLVNCTSFLGNSADAIEEYASGSSGLLYLGDGNWHFNWKTPKTYAEQCRTMVLTLGDNSTHTAQFKFK